MMVKWYINFTSILLHIAIILPVLIIAMHNSITGPIHQNTDNYLGNHKIQEIFDSI